MPSIDVRHFNVTMKLGEAVDCASELCQRILCAAVFSTNLHTRPANHSPIKARQYQVQAASGSQ